MSRLAPVMLENTSDIIHAHVEDDCMFVHCPLHNRSDHHMRSWPQHWRGDRRIMERICEHGVGHPDPDDPETLFDSVHGCDINPDTGRPCCAPPE